ncbi:MAG: hypothetical protein SFV17_23395 [Candidatus Obscuribacter sp.]|nr:hypothetical protein [Candidatus Melainabacteria bacterium]MDX1989655.1 hypothetical protein [Candidatus Obscuribacter sp.]
MFSQRGAHLIPKQERQAVSIKPVMSLALLTLLSLQQLPAQAQSVGDIVSGQVLRQLMGGQAGQRRQLPPVRMDSFVDQAGGHAEHIYGDEGANGLPPYFGFSKAHRIDTGIQGIRNQGLTTGHGSVMPDAWGGDEYIGAEWSDTNRGRPPMHWGGENLDAAALGQAAAAAVVQGVVGGTISSGGGGDPGSGNGLPPPPGEGYQPATVHGQFVGYYSPEEVALSQTDFPAAFEQFVYSGRYLGSAENARYILENEMGRPQGGRTIPGN